MKILYLSTSAQLGGAELCLLDMMAGVRECRPQWPIVLLAPAAGPLLERAKQLGMEARTLEYPAPLARLGDSGAARNGTSRMRLMSSLAVAAPAIARYRARLRRAIRQFSPELIHANGLKANLLAAWAAEPGAPVVWHLHDYLGVRAIAARMARSTARRHPAAVAIANSHSIAAEAAQIFAPADLPVRVLHNAIDLQEFSPSGPQLDLDALAGLPAAPPATVRVGLICTMAWWKGQHDFIRALGQLPAELPLRGYVIGGPIYETGSRQCSLEELRAFAAQHGASRRIGFTGFVAQPAAAMRALDIVVHASSEPEPFGRVIVEAMACGKPVITAALGGAAELISDGHDALTFTAGEAASLASRIAQLAADADLRQRLAQNGLARARAAFDRRRLGPQLLEIYALACGRRVQSAKGTMA